MVLVWTSRSKEPAASQNTSVGGLPTLKPGGPPQVKDAGLGEPVVLSSRAVLEVLNYKIRVHSCFVN